MVGQPSILSRLMIASAIPHGAATIVYKSLLDVEPSVRTITEIGAPSRTSSGDWIIKVIDDAHPERACSTFRVDRIETLCSLWSLAGPEQTIVAL